MNHGVSGLVSQGYAEVTVQVTVNNATHHPVILQANQFRMLRQAGTAPGLDAAAGDDAAGGPASWRASVSTRLTFVTPTDGSRLWLQYTDPGMRPQVLVDLGSTEKIAAPVEPHQH